MTVMLLGLLLFLASHLMRALAGGWRERQISRHGETAWKAACSVLALVGLVLAIYGYGLTRADATLLWAPPAWTQHLLALAMIPAFLLLFAAYAPANRLRNAVGHPLLLAVGVWALAHLTANARLGDILFFGAFLAWVAIAYPAARRRDQAAGRALPEPRPAGEAVTVAGGLAGYLVFALFLHVPITGVPAYG